MDIITKKQSIKGDLTMEKSHVALKFPVKIGQVSEICIVDTCHVPLFFVMTTLSLLFYS